MHLAIRRLAILVTLTASLAGTVVLGQNVVVRSLGKTTKRSAGLAKNSGCFFDNIRHGLARF